MTDKIKPTLLLAEDDSSLRDLLVLAFSQAGWQVICAPDGVEALALARRCQPQVMLLDILLPKINGLDVLRLLKKQAGFEQLPIIVMSELAFRETVQQAITAGAQDFLVKPFDLQVLLDKAQRSILQPASYVERPRVALGRGPQVRPFFPQAYKKTAENLPPAG
jgi:DNA-binding response OmpR family regulator